MNRAMSLFLVLLLALSVSVSDALGAVQRDGVEGPRPLAGRLDAWRAKQTHAIAERPSDEA